MIEQITMAAPAVHSKSERTSVIVFGSQGAKTLFSPATARTAFRNTLQSSSTIELISQCHAAFHRDCQSLSQEMRARAHLELSDFNQLTDFLNPKQQYHDNAIMQATTICLHQLLHYLGNVDRSGVSFENSTHAILETTGFCSGLLPACVVACSRNTAEFIHNGVAAMRLAFWTAYRSSLLAEEFAKGPVGPCSLVSIGQDKATLEKKLLAFKKETGHNSLHLSAILSETAHSISGPNPHLEAFEQYLGSKRYTQYAPIHGWYHGGYQLESLVHEVEQSLMDSNVVFPTHKDIHIPIRSSFDGSIFGQEKDSDQNLARWVMRHMLVHPINFLQTSAQLLEASFETTEKLFNSKVTISSYGPNSKSLFSNLKSAAPEFIELVDLSPFTADDEPIQTGREDIAIVGKAFQLPQAQDDDELQDMLSQGINTTSEIPESRFNWMDYNGKTALTPKRSMATKYGAFLDNIWGFDHTFFNISPREAKSMDPQQRILLQVAKNALEDAGYVADATPSFQRSSVGCYIGLATGDYPTNLKDDIDVFYTPGTLRAFHSGRISYALKLGGPSMTLDTACSSSLVSIYQACRAISNGDCTSAIAGGVNTICNPDMYLGLSAAHFLSSTGGCKPFDSSADGYCRGEGCTIFVLKKLSDAIAENDRIHGVIKGIEVNHSGNASSITHPHSETQIELMNRVLKNSDINPASIGAVEAHGTGTQAGDSTEIKSLQSVFEFRSSTSQPVYVSSIKGNIGHSEAASGGAGLAKLLLMMNRKTIYQQANFRQLNPKLSGLEKAGLLIPTANSSWASASDGPRRALLNNFGASGSNAALVLEEYKMSQKRRSQGFERSQYIFNLSARSSNALITMLQQMQNRIAELGDDVSLADICYTTSARRQTYDYRVSIPCFSKSDLLSKIQSKIRDTVSIETISRPSNTTVFVFSGQGSIYRGMGQELYATNTYFKELVEKCDGIVQELGFPGFVAYLENDSEHFDSLAEADQLVASHCALVSLQYALASLFISWGITPEYAIGHSIGEYAALAVVGAIEIADALYVAANRAKLLASRCHPGHYGMVAVKASTLVTEKLLRRSSNLDELEIACKNSPESCVVSGPNDQLVDLEMSCAKDQIRTKRLDVPFGFHSSSMNPILHDLERLGKSVSWKKPKIRFVSTVLGKCVDASHFSSDYIAKHTRQPVSFVDAVHDMDQEADLNGATCLEIGPHPNTMPMLREILNDRVIKPVAILRRDQKAWVGISACLSQCFVDGLPINWLDVFKDVRANVASLPGHPLQEVQSVVPWREGPSDQAESSGESNTKFKFLRSNALTSSPHATTFATGLDVIAPFIRGHSVGGIPICPASVYHEICLEAVSLLHSDQPDMWITVENMTFPNPLTLSENKSPKAISVKIEKDSNNPTKGSVRFSDSASGNSLLFCSADYIVGDTETNRRQWFREGAIATRQSQYLETCPQVNRFNRRILYEVVFDRVVKYSEEYQTIHDLRVLESSHEGSARFKMTTEGLADGYVVNPIFTDTLLHAAGFIANMNAKDDEIYICHHVENINVDSKVFGDSDEFTVYSCLYDGAKGSYFADSTALDRSGNVVACIRGMHFKKIRKSGFQRLINPAQPSTAPEAQAAPPVVNADVETASANHAKPQTGYDKATILALVLETVSKVSGCSSENLAPSQKMESLGIDSLMQIEMISFLKNSIEGLEIDHNSIADCETIEDLQNSLLRAFPAGSSSQEPTRTAPSSAPNKTEGERPNSSNPICLSRSNSNASPLCLIHDGSGQSGVYSRIEANRDVLGFSDPYFGSKSGGFNSINEMADCYATQLVNANLKSVILGGWSFGGVVAYEMSQQLLKRGIKVIGLLLIDSPYPIGHTPLPESVISGVISSFRGNSGSSSSKAISTDLFDQFRRCAMLLREYQPSSRAPIKTVLLHSKETIDTKALYGVQYDWLSESESRKAGLNKWGQLVGQDMRVLEIEGNHFEAFLEPFVQTTSKQVMEGCKIIQQSH